MTEHLGYEKRDPPEAGTSNVRNGTRSKTVLTDTTGAVEIDVPRDRAATFEPQIVKKRQRRLTGVDEVVLSLYAKGLSTGEISAHFAECEVRGASIPARLPDTRRRSFASRWIYQRGHELDAPSGNLNRDAMAMVIAVEQPKARFYRNLCSGFPALRSMNPSAPSASPPCARPRRS